MTDTDLVCDECHEGPFLSLAGLLVHQRSHVPAAPAPPEAATDPAANEPAPTAGVECPDCDRRFATAAALGAHRRSHRSDEEKAAERRARQLAPALTALMPGAATELVERLTAFVATHEPAAHLWVVASATDGPWLCHRVEVGRVGERAKAPIVAVPLQLVLEHLRLAAAGRARTGRS
jgi:hypothetical protein